MASEQKIVSNKIKNGTRVPGGPVVKDSELPLQGSWVQSLIRELGSHMQSGMAKKNGSSLRIGFINKAVCEFKN